MEEVCVGPTSKQKDGSKKSRAAGVLGRILSDRDLPGRKSIQPQLPPPTSTNATAGKESIFFSFRINSVYVLSIYGGLCLCEFVVLILTWCTNLTINNGFEIADRSAIFI